MPAQQTCRQAGRAAPELPAKLIISAILFLSINLAASADIDVIAIKEGADLDLSCPIVVQKADMIISWTCDDEPASIRSSRIHVTESGKLRIRAAKVGDSCNYRCETAEGFGALSVVIKVMIVDKRHFERIPKQTSTNRSSAGDLQSQLGGLQRQQQQQQVEAEKFAQSLDILHKSSHTPDELELELSPGSLRVDKNQIFSLECRVKHAAHLMMPQIIWLKQLIGRRPATLSQAHEQNLVLIDGHYYHSLNWPRSITYSQKASTSSSAILIRQSSYVHSGKYICFAGYPPAIMAANLSSSAAGGEHRRSLKYKMAMAEVKVDDEEGEASYQAALDSAADGHELQADYPPTSRWRSLVRNVLTSNTWTRNLILILSLVCCLLFVTKTIVIRYRSSRGPPANFSGQISAARADRRPADYPRAAYTVTSVSSPKSADELTLAGSSSRYSAGIMMLRAGDDRQLADDHLYSEIGERSGQLEPEDSLYKVPRVLSRIEPS